ncbi:EscU/YscU/HrcU family type III secretion system export apparatus switch protein [Paludisphaera sp.]|uniref:EscU/YscU/HrcU family type III secretion system export apparatus switch protein n=1 Tax=Paludisphaera sp. TaxID=2017432 RepID=UPI00301DA837
MSEDRTQAASPRRRQLAREQGKVAHSPELSAAVGWLVAVALLAWRESSLIGSLVDVARVPLIDPGASLETAGDLGRLAWGVAATVAPPFAVMIAGFSLGATAAHMIQTRGMFSPALLAPDSARLWRVGQGGGIGAKLERSVWSIVKAVVLTFVAFWGLRSCWGELQGLAFQDFPTAVPAAMAILRAPAWALAGAMVVVGMVDYGLRLARFEAMLRMSPEEQREDQKSLDGDPKVRASRRRMAQALRDETPELLAGATLALVGDAGLVVVLSGGPPPRKVFARISARGRTAATIRRAIRQAKLPEVEAPQLALRIASSPAASPRAAIADPLLIAQLREAWPRG